MRLSYDGDAHERLLERYREDAEPFPTETAMNFPPRNHWHEEVGLLKRLLFPRCWNADALVYDSSVVLNEIEKLGALVSRGVRPFSNGEPSEAVESVLDRLPELRDALKRDAEAAYKGDPAANSYIEILRSYPGFRAITIQRFAHMLYETGNTEYARELTEYGKTVTGIDIHPGAEIGEYFFIDHGTGVVIGETATVGDWVRIYQDVTLGALHFEEEEDDEKTLKKGYKRHPDIGDHVVIGAGTKVLGPVEIGDHVSIGANSWITEPVPDHTKVYVAEHPTLERKRQD
ncbi:serine O-acetyltransferase EpsC [Natronorarus salvus]|uniref:serine O-acetyltransferase EpsC n=1 Tax=Natronorarus salvus TaxID=3117733 RepID=UPI002F25F8A7